MSLDAADAAIESGVTAEHEWIRVDRLTKIYRPVKGAPVHAIAEASFSVRRGEFVAVVGPSGCGKTTLLNVLAGLVPRTSGSIFLAGTPIDGPRRDIGVVFQLPVLLPWRTILQNVMIPAEVQGLDRKAAHDRAQTLLKSVGLAGFENRHPNELSGGMQQRAGICRALIHDPGLLLMDEPFGALDAMTREYMNLELLRIWSERKKTVLLITHGIAEAVFLADRVFVMTPRPGRIAETVDIPLPRPRVLGMLQSPVAGALIERIRSHFSDVDRS